MNAKVTTSASMVTRATQPVSRDRHAMPPPPQVDVDAQFKRWDNALKSRDVAKVLACYSHDAVLLPTVADEPHVGHGAIAEYFKHFLANSPRGTVTERHVQVGWDMAVDMGTYSFVFADGRVVVARFTFIYRPRAGEWLITHHHSSVLPEKFCAL
jgi:uncharacterized protein (TIGR02246 family)